MDDFIFKTPGGTYMSSSNIIDFKFGQCPEDRAKQCVQLLVYGYGEDRHYYQRAVKDHIYNENTPVYTQMTKIKEKSIN